MKSSEVLEFYNVLKEHGIPVWVDGGWCVDALIGSETRMHLDLDIAVDRKHAVQLRSLIGSLGFDEDPRNDTTEWNYAMKDKKDRSVDIHVFEFDNQGNNIYGIEYPKESLSGTGTIDGQEVQCISPEWMFKFKTAYEPKQKDLQDVRALAKKFGYPIPATHQKP